MERLKSGLEFIFSSYKRTAAILFIGALTLAIPITITLVGQQQDIRQRASSSVKAPPCFMPESIITQLGASPEKGYGDVDGDTLVSQTDSDWILQYEAGKRNFNTVQIEAADVNGPPNVLSSKGDVNSKDTTFILQYVAGLISTFNACPTTTDTIPPTSVITSPAAGSTQTGNFYVSVTDSDNAGVSGLICYYGVTDLNNGFTVERTKRPCNSQILITVGPNGNCRTEGTNKCTVRADSTDKAGNLASLSFRNFSISYSGTGGPPTATPTTPPGVTAAPTATPTPCPTPVASKVPIFLALKKILDRSLIPQTVFASHDEAERTPTPTPTPCPTPTTTPTPTGVPPGTTGLSISITLPGIGVSQNTALGINNNPKRPQRNVDVTIVNSSNQQVTSTTSTVNYDSATGKYRGNVNLGSNFVSGSYLIKVRLDNALRKTIPGIQNITSGQTYNAPEAALVSGDIIQDNEINLLDYNALLSCIGTQACATKVQADMNDDDKVDELDLNVLYAGFAKRVGD